MGLATDAAPPSLLLPSETRAVTQLGCSLGSLPS